MNMNQSNHKPSKTIASYVHNRSLTFIKTDVNITLFKE